ncbi:MAG: GNAT family N-acetyltransferase [Syntrophales bacterium]
MNIYHKIIHFREEYLTDIAESFVQSFNTWDSLKASVYLKNIYKSNPDQCFASIDFSSNCEGAIFGKVVPYLQGEMYVIEVLQVKEEFRKRGVGSALLEKVRETAIRGNIAFLGMSVPLGKKFPLSWYEKIGFKRTGWVEVASETRYIHL